MSIEQYSAVRLTTNEFLGEGVGVGAIGYVIEIYGNGDLEVEFSRSDGVTIAQLTLQESHLESAPG
jgi:hypothetical protein